VPTNPTLSLKARLDKGERAIFQKDDVPIAFYQEGGVYYLRSSELQPHRCRSFAEGALALLDLLAEWEVD
jgi:hypothetical protein